MANTIYEVQVFEVAPPLPVGVVRIGKVPDAKELEPMTVEGHSVEDAKRKLQAALTKAKRKVRGIQIGQSRSGRIGFHVYLHGPPEK